MIGILQNGLEHKVKIDSGLMGTSDLAEIPEQVRKLEAEGYDRYVGEAA